MSCFMCGAGRNEKKFNPAQQAISVSESVAKSAIAWVRGRPVFTDEEMRVRRLRVCNTCNYRQLVGRKLRCGICGCDVPLKSKIKETQCPEGKW